jgi:uncharacterized protein (TIGR02246 family)
MNRTRCTLMSLLLAVVPLCDVALSAASEDEASIRRLQIEQADAWNRHDAAGYVRLFAPEGDIVNVMGWWWQGHEQMQAKLSAVFSTSFRTSELTITSTDVRFLTPTIAVAHVHWTMAGFHMPPGLPEPREGIEIQVLQKKAGHWLIQSFQNTIGVPEKSFPSAPPTATAKP